MCTWAICWLRTRKEIKEHWIGWALFVDFLIFSSLMPGDFIHLEFGG